MTREHDDRRLETVPGQDAHGLAAVDVGQADIHDYQINLSLLGGLHAPAAVLRRGSFKLLVHRKLLCQCVAQFGIIVDNENYAYRHQFPTATCTRGPICLSTAGQASTVAGLARPCCCCAAIQTAGLKLLARLLPIWQSTVMRRRTTFILEACLREFPACQSLAFWQTYRRSSPFPSRPLPPALKMRVAPSFVVERVEDGEGRRPHLNGESEIVPASAFTKGTANAENQRLLSPCWLRLQRRK